MWVNHHGAALRVIGKYHALCNRNSKAQKYFLKSIRQTEFYKRKYETAKGYYEYGLFLRSLQKEEAQEKFQRAYEVFREIGAIKYIQLCSDILDIQVTGEDETTITSQDRLKLERKMATVLGASRNLSSILKLDELLDRIMTSTIELVGAERGALYLYPEKEEGSVRVPELELKVVHDVKKSTNTDTFHVSKRILKNIEEEKKPLIISDAGGDKELKTSASVVRTGLKSVLCAPIMIKGEMLGVIYLDSRLVSGLFKEEDLQVLELLASQSAVSIQNARLYQKTIDLYKQLIQKERLEQDLQIAGEIQKYFLPRSIEGIEELKIDTHYKPAEFVGGDYYDIVKIRKKKYGIIIVDISGHGSSAAIVMSVISSIFHSVVDKVKDTAELISILSERLHERLEGEKYATGIFIIYDEQKDQFEFTNAGHNNILLYNRAKGKVEEIPGGHGVPIGVFENSKYKTGKFKMKKGDIILLQTDGVYETKNEKGKLLELERVREMLGRYSNMEPEGINKSILDEVDRFRGKGKQDDDITLITIKKVK